MQRLTEIIIRLTLVSCGLLTVPVVAQESGQDRAENLRAQLVEIQSKQTELQMRHQQLTDDLKPENIERALAGIGSTHPEDLREQRRRQLEIEKKGVETQLETLAASRARLEAAIVRADAISYQSAAVGTGLRQSESISPTVNKGKHAGRHKTKKHRRH